MSGTICRAPTISSRLYRLSGDGENHTFGIKIKKKSQLKIQSKKKPKVSMGNGSYNSVFLAAASCLRGMLCATTSGQSEQRPRQESSLKHTHLGLVQLLNEE